MTEFYCSCCDKKFEQYHDFYSILDGDRELFLHEECVSTMSGGLDLIDAEEKCDIIVEGIVVVNSIDNVFFQKIGSDILHRTNGPAIIRANGEKEWWVEGRRHREDGPAIEWLSKTYYWYLNGKHYSQCQWRTKVRKIRKKRAKIERRKERENLSNWGRNDRPLPIRNCDKKVTRRSLCRRPGCDLRRLQARRVSQRRRQP